MNSSIYCRRLFFHLVLAAVAITRAPAVDAADGAVPTSSRPPNILLILSDDQGWNQAGYHGFDWYETPNIDRIAREGIHFTSAYSAAPICSPTRAALMTGKYPARLHLTDYIPGNPHADRPLVTPQMRLGLPLEETTLPELLATRGYVSGHFGKWHLAADYDYEPWRPRDPESQGFDEVFVTLKPESENPPEHDTHNAIAITDHAVAFMEKHRDEAFFCYVAHNVVHRPLFEEPELIAKYEAKPGAGLPVHNPVMGAMIERMDTGIGRLLETLDRLDLANDTLVIFISDNGGLRALQHQDPLRAGKSTLFEGGIRVPQAIRWPGVIQPGRVSGIPVITHDLFVTIMEAAGVQLEPGYSDGESLLPILRGDDDELERTAIFWHYPHYHHFGGVPSSAVRVGQYKLIEWHEQRLLGSGSSISLFDLESDPGETHDLAGEFPEVVRDLRNRLHAWRASVRAQEMTLR
ncbi:MAG: sulfatase [Opitutaceae bacterium]